MGIDRKRVEELKGAADAGDRPIRCTADLVRLCRACRTAGELRALWPRIYKHLKVQGEICPAEKAANVHRRRLPGESEAIELVWERCGAAGDMPPDTLLDEHFWSSKGS